MRLTTRGRDVEKPDLKGQPRAHEYRPLFAYDMRGPILLAERVRKLSGLSNKFLNIMVVSLQLSARIGL